MNNEELINQIVVISKEDASKQLGNNIANYIYNNATENTNSLRLKENSNTEIIDTSHKGKQLDIIKKTNPMLDDYHVGLRTVEDIKTFDEVINDEESFAWGDFSKNDAEKALKAGKITIVSTSYIQAEEYAGGKDSKVYSKTVPIEEVAWINGDEGQYANINQKYSMTKDSHITGDDIAVKDMLKQEKNTIEDEVGNNQVKEIDIDPKENINTVDLQKYLDEHHVDYSIDEDGNITSIENEDVLQDYLNSKEVNEKDTKEQKSAYKELQQKYKQMEIGKREYEKLLRRENNEKIYKFF